MLNSEDPIHTARMRMISWKFAVLSVKIEDMLVFQDLRPIHNGRLPVKENMPYANKTK